MNDKEFEELMQKRKAQTPDDSSRTGAAEGLQTYEQKLSARKTGRAGIMDSMLSPDNKIIASNVANRSNFSRGVASGIDSTQALLHGAVGAMGDAVGADGIKKWGYEGFKSNMKEASLNPLDVENFTDITTNQGVGKMASDTGKWLSGSIGQLVPSVAESLVTAGVGAAIGGSAAPVVGAVPGAIAGFVGKTGVKKLLENKAEKYLATEVGKKLIEKEGIAVAKNIATKQAYRAAGAGLGIVAGTGPLEGGGMWGDDATKHGVDNANPYSAIALGTLSGATELFSPGGMIARKFAAGGGDMFKGLVKGEGRKLLTRMGIEIPKAIGGEFAQEAVQEFISKANEAINDTTGKVNMMDKEALTQYFNAGMKGAAGGLAFGAHTAYSENSDAKAANADKVKLEKVTKLQEDVAKVKENIVANKEIVANFDPQSEEHIRATNELKKLDKTLAKHENNITILSEELGIGKMPTDEQSFGKMVDPSLTIEEVADGIDKGVITKEVWDNTDKTKFTPEMTEAVDQHLQDYSNTIQINNMAEGKGIVLEEKPKILDGALDGTNKGLFTTLPEGYSDQDAVDALQTDFVTVKKDKAPKVTLSTTPNDETTEQIAGILGVKVVKVSIDAQDGTIFNGIASPGNKGLLYVNEKAARPEMWVFGHEYGHNLEKSNPDAYNTLLKVAAGEVSKEKVSEYQKEMDTRLGLKKGTTDATTATKEMLSDFIGDRFIDKEFWGKLHKENPSKFKEIVLSVQEYVKKILAKFTGVTSKADEFFGNMAKLNDTLTQVINEHIGYSGAVEHLSNSAIKTGEVTDLNKDNKHFTNISLGKESSMVLRETKDQILIKRLSRPGSRRGTNLVADSNHNDKGVPTKALEELKKYATENNKTIVAETDTVNPYLAGHNFTSEGGNMAWKPGNDERITEARAVASDKSFDPTAGSDPQAYESARTSLEDSLKTLEAKLKITRDGDIQEDRDVIKKKLIELNKERGKAVKFATKEMQDAKTEILDIEAKKQIEMDAMRISTSREDIKFSKEQVDKFDARIKELNDVVTKSESTLGSKTNETTNDATEKGKSSTTEKGKSSTTVSGKESTVKEKSVSKEPDSGNGTEQGKTAVPEVKKVPKLLDKVTEIKQEASYKESGNLVGDLSRVVNKLAKDGKSGDPVAFMEAVSAMGADTITVSGEEAFQNAFRQHTMKEENDIANSPMGKEQAKEKNKKTKRLETKKERLTNEATDALRTKEDKVKLNVLTQMLLGNREVKGKLAQKLDKKKYEEEVDTQLSDIQDNKDFEDNMTAERELQFSVDQAPFNTETEEFKEWFNGSKISDKNGTPIKMYHGAIDPNYSIFKNKQGNGWFTMDPVHASTYVGWDNQTWANSIEDTDIKNIDKSKKDIEARKVRHESFRAMEPMQHKNTGEIADPEESGGVYQVYLSIKNPAILSKTTVSDLDYGQNLDGDNITNATVFGELGITKEQFEKFALENKNFMYPANKWDSNASMETILDDPTVHRFLESLGYDGISISERGTPTFAPFSANQVKSINNRGTWNKSNDDIMFSVDKDPKFQSNLSKKMEELNVETKFPRSMKGSDWISLFNKMVQKGKFNKDEVQFSFAYTMLDGNREGTFSREEVLDTFRNNPITVENEVRDIGNSNDNGESKAFDDLSRAFETSDKEARSRIHFGIAKSMNVSMLRGSKTKLAEVASRTDKLIADVIKEGMTTEQKVNAIKNEPTIGKFAFTSIALEHAGEYYRNEMAYTDYLSTMQDLGEESANEWLGDNYDMDIDQLMKALDDSGATYHEMTLPGGMGDYFNYLVKYTPNTGRYRGTGLNHWSQENVIAHFRGDTFNVANGEDSALLMVEAQSDWHSDRVGNKDLKFVPPAPFSKSWPLLLFKHAMVKAYNSGTKFIAWPSKLEQLAKIEGWGNIGPAREKYIQPIVKHYTEEMPKQIGAYVKDFGGKVEKINIDNGEGGTHEVFAVEITPKMEDIIKNSQIMQFSVDIDPKDPHPEVEKRITEAEEVPAVGKLRSIKDHVTALVKSFRSPVAELVPGKYGFLKDRIRLAKEVEKFGSLKAYTKIYKVVGTLSDDERRVFGMNIVLNDIMRDTKPDKNGVTLLKDGHLPFGYNTVAEVRESLRHYREQAKKSPKIMTSLANRLHMMGELQDQLIAAGYLSKDAKGNDSYFHHQTLQKLRSGDDYLFGMHVKIGNKKLAWTTDRGEEIGKYTTNYVVSEFNVLSDAIATMELNKIVQQIREKYDITSDLEKKANGGKLTPPANFVEWSPSRHTGWGVAPTYPDILAANIMSAAKVDPEVMRQMQIASGNKKPWIVPERVANAMGRIRTAKATAMPGKVSNALVQSWKKWMLINPLRVLKYNLNNMSGDLDIAMAYDWRILKFMPQAMSDIAGDVRSSGLKLPFNMQRYGAALSPQTKAELEEAHRLGALDAGFVMHEVTDVSSEMENLLRGPKGSSVTKFGLNWWQGSKDITNYRENILRLASYRYFKERLTAGDKGVYGASIPSEVDEITNISEKAAKLSRELIGDYGNLSEGGQWMRKHMMPFYSWVEINSPRYFRMMKNLKDEGKGMGGIGASLTWKTSVLGVKFMLFTALVSAWNHMLFGDEEDELAGEQARNMHLILGRRADGSIRYLQVQGAFKDMLSMVASDDLPDDIKDVVSGDIPFSTKLKEAGLATPVRIISGSRPFTKLGYEYATGLSLYPDPFNPRPIRDKFDYVAKSMSLEMLTRIASGKPTRGVVDEFQNKLYWNVDPGESAYYDIRTKVKNFNNRVGYFPTIPMMSSNSTNPASIRSNALANYKLSLKYADMESAAKYLKLYKANGGKDKGLKSSYKLIQPTGGLRKKDKSAFYKTLTERDKELLNKASKWHKQTFSDLN